MKRRSSTTSAVPLGSRRPRFLLVFGRGGSGIHLKWALVIVFCLGGTGMTAPNAYADQRRDSAEVLRLLTPIAGAVRTSMAQVMVDSRAVSLAAVVHPDGYLVTKHSELSSDPIRVRLYDGRIYPARIAAVRRQNDLALLHIAGAGSLTPIKFEPFLPSMASLLITPGRTGSAIGLGVMGGKPRPITPRGRLGVRLSDGPMGRALVDKVIRGSGAQEAGIVPGDVIVEINGVQQNSRESVVATLRSIFPGERVRLTVLRSRRQAPDYETPEDVANNNASKNNPLGADAASDGESSEGGGSVELDARISDWSILGETENDTLVNGPRNLRISGFDRVIQHDTVLDPDQCGGPVLDSSGRVVGLNIARAGRVVTYALPSSLVIGEIEGLLRQINR